AALRESRRRLEEEACVSAALVRVGHGLIASLSEPELLDRLCQLTVEVMDCDASQTWLSQPNDGALVARTGFGPTPGEGERGRGVRIAREELQSFLARLERERVVWLRGDDVVRAGLGALAQQGALADGLYVALRRGDEIVGFQTACRRDATRDFDAAQLRVAEGIGQLASMALANTQLL